MNNFILCYLTYFWCKKYVTQFSVKKNDKEQVANLLSVTAKNRFLLGVNIKAVGIIFFCHKVVYDG